MAESEFGYHEDIPGCQFMHIFVISFDEKEKYVDWTDHLVTTTASEAGQERFKLGKDIFKRCLK